MAKGMTGTCEFCGQTQFVSADTQAEADRLVTESCNCAGGELARKKKELKERLDELIGEQAPDYGWEPAGTAKAYKAICKIAEVIAEGGIESVGIRIDKTNLKIGNKGGKIIVERSKTVKQSGTIDK